MTSNVRQRQNHSKTQASQSPNSGATSASSGALPISGADILRTVLSVSLLTALIAYYVTSNAPWNYLPKEFRNLSALKSWYSGPLLLTPEQLALYNGTDPDLPIYLAINKTIFDVSESARTYGPGGSYSIFAGRDATRAYVTGCFLEDRTSDLRGAELLYIPIDDEDEEITSAERKTRAERERREAKKRVRDEVDRWEGFYRNHKKYFEVGKLVGAPTEYTGEPPKLCDAAEKGRPKRKNIKKNETKDTSGKPVQ